MGPPTSCRRCIVRIETPYAFMNMVWDDGRLATHLNIIDLAKAGALDDELQIAAKGDGRLIFVTVFGENGTQSAAWAQRWSRADSFELHLVNGKRDLNAPGGYVQTAWFRDVLSRRYEGVQEDPEANTRYGGSVMVSINGQPFRTDQKALARIESEYDLVMPTTTLADLAWFNDKPGVEAEFRTGSNIAVLTINLRPQFNPATGHLFYSDRGAAVQLNIEPLEAITKALKLDGGTLSPEQLADSAADGSLQAQALEKVLRGTQTATPFPDIETRPTSLIMPDGSEVPIPSEELERLYDGFKVVYDNQKLDRPAQTLDDFSGKNRGHQREKPTPKRKKGKRSKGR